jgi:ATP-dependent protease ClpP protease subunit
MIKLLLALLFVVPTLAANRVIDLTTTNHILIRGEISTSSMDQAAEQFANIVLKRTGGETIYVVLDSPGGDIQAGNDFIEFAKLVGNVETISMFSASMAAGIVQGLPGKRLVTENGTVMFHRASGGFQGQFEDGEVESRLAYAKSLVRSMEIRNSERMSLPLKGYKSKIRNELWLYGRDAVNQKAADEVIDLRCSKELVEAKTVSYMSIMGMFTIKVESSKCPLLKGIKAIKPTDEEQTALTKYAKTYTNSGILRVK